MPAPANSTEFIDLLRRSGVIDEKRLDAWLQKLRAGGVVPPESTKFATLMVREGLITTFQAEQLLQGKWKRFSIGKYRILDKIGGGGMANVFLCEHKLMRRRVAVKVLPVAKANDPASLERFYREGRIVAALDHPNIVHAYDIDQDEDLHFLVMEYVEGASFQDLIKKSGPLDVTRACHYISQAAVGLDHAHQAGLVHRDIKPGNIIVDRHGQVKILDMGLARFFNDEEDILTKKFDENVLGTADYLAPEQAIDSHGVDIRADIYSLGATFYFLLTGKTPFGEGTVAQKLMWHQHRQPRPITELRADVPPELWAILLKMMAKDPGQRYAVPGDVVRELIPFTKNPIPPPADSEMPQSSSGAAGPSSDASRTQGRTPNPTPRPAQSRTPSPPISLPASPSPAPATPRPQPVQAAPATTVAAEPEDDADWQALQGTGGDANSKGEKQPLRTGGLNQRDQQKLYWIGGAVTALLVVALVILTWVFIVNGPITEKKGRPILVVTKVKQPGKEHIYGTIQEAIRYSLPGDIIELADATHEENLIIDGGPSQNTRVTLKVAAGKEVVWSSARNDASVPLIMFSRAAEFRILGQNLTLDGKGKTNNLIVITSYCPGLSLEGMRMENYARTGITFMNANGKSDNYIQLARLTVDAPPKTLAPIYLDINPSIQPPYNDFINIASDCTFTGVPQAKGVQRKDNTVIGNKVNWKFE